MARARGIRKHRAVTRSVLRIPRARPFAPLALVGAAALVAATAFAVLPGAGSYALWNGASSSNAGTVTGGVVSASETMGPTLAFTFRSGQTVTTGGVAVTNTGTVTSSLSSVITLGSGSSAALAAAIAITVWPVASTASCTAAATVPSGAYYSTWSAAAGIPLTGTIAPGATTAYCIRSSMNVASAPGVASGSSVALTITSTVTAGTWTSSAAVNATQSFLDDIAPTAPTGLTAATSTTAPVVLSWTASTDNVGVAGYDIYRSGTGARLGTTTSTTFTDSTAAANTSYTYTVSARDAVPQSSTGTALLVDRVAPTKPTLTLTSSTATSASLSFSSTDAVGVTRYTIYRDGAAVASVAAPATAFTNTALPPGNHTFTVTAADAAGNVSTVSIGVAVSTPVQAASWYQVVSTTTGSCVAVPSAGLASGSAVGQLACASTTAAGGQAWRLPAIGSTGAVTSALPSTSTPQYFWAASGTTSNAVVQVGTNSAQTRSQWTTTALANGLFRFSVSLTTNGTALCLDAAGGGQLKATACSANLASQQFTLVAVTP